MNITKGKQSRPQRVVIYGAEGVGKSTLAAVNAPAPLFLDTEDGSAHLEVDRVHINTLDDLRSAVAELLGMSKRGGCAYKSLILDTADRLWALCAEAVCKENAWASIESPGYGRGYAQAAERFRAVFAGFDALMRAGFHVVIICHAKMDRVTPPDNPEYTKYMIKVNAPSRQAEVSREFIKEWCDALLFCHFDVTVDAEKRRALGRDVRRVVSTEPSPAWEAKNRIGLPRELPMQEGALAPLFEGIPAPSVQGQAEMPGMAKQGDAVELTDADRELLTAYFVGLGKLGVGQTLEDLPPNLHAAIASRPQKAIEAAIAWAESQKGGEA